jgi:hypothetical protein
MRSRAPVRMTLSKRSRRSARKRSRPALPTMVSSLRWALKKKIMRRSCSRRPWISLRVSGLLVVSTRVMRMRRWESRRAILYSPMTTSKGPAGAAGAVAGASPETAAVAGAGRGARGTSASVRGGADASETGAADFTCPPEGR